MSTPIEIETVRTDDPRRPVWEVTVTTPNGGQLVCHHTAVGATPFQAQEWALSRTQAARGTVTRIRAVHDVKAVATRFHDRHPADVEGGDPGDPAWIHIGEVSVQVPADKVKAVLAALAVTAESVIAQHHRVGDPRETAEALHVERFPNAPELQTERFPSPRELRNERFSR